MFLFMAVEIVSIFDLVLLYCFAVIVLLYFLVDFMGCPDSIMKWCSLTWFRDYKFAAFESC